MCLWSDSCCFNNFLDCELNYTVLKMMKILVLRNIELIVFNNYIIIYV